MFGTLALVSAALFSGAAIYITWAEQPARLTIDDRALLAQWKFSYSRGFTMQASLAVAGFVFGVLEWLMTGAWTWLAGAAVLVANWPYTMFVIMPTNNQLDAISAIDAGPASRALIVSWGRLHAVRSALGTAALLLFIWASM